MAQCDGRENMLHGADFARLFADNALVTIKVMARLVVLTPRLLRMTLEAPISDKLNVVSYHLRLQRYSIE